MIPFFVHLNKKSRCRLAAQGKLKDSGLELRVRLNKIRGILTANFDVVLFAADLSIEGFGDLGLELIECLNGHDLDGILAQLNFDLVAWTLVHLLRGYIYLF